MLARRISPFNFRNIAIKATLFLIQARLLPDTAPPPPLKILQSSGSSLNWRNI